MPAEISFAYLHFVALIGTASLLVTEAFLCRPGIRGEALHRLKNVDIAYAGFAVAALLTGAMRLFWGAKGSAYYLANPVFHAKFGLFVAVALLSILPTVRFIGWSKAARADAGFTPAAGAMAGVRRLLMLELLVLAAIPLLATLMAHGVSRFGAAS
jgi:putative membrane protein